MKVVFLDRDGTLIVEPPQERLIREEHTVLFPETLPALELLAEHGFAMVVITNQAGIGEGLITVDEFWRLQENFLKLIAPSGIHVLGTYLCPHRKDDACDCRKPKPKLILDAATEHGIELAGTYMVGDRLTDIEAGKAAGTNTVLVKTGNAVVQSGFADYDAVDLLEAARYITDN